MDALSSGIRETELIISDYRLSGGITGVELIRKLRAESGRNVPAIILTGDITIGNKEDFLPGNCLLVRKPVAAGELNRQIRQQLDHSPG
jgi:two-component system CheB/CheR fusion protein